MTIVYRKWKDNSNITIHRANQRIIHQYWQRWVWGGVIWSGLNAYMVMSVCLPARCLCVFVCVLGHLGNEMLPELSLEPLEFWVWLLQEMLVFTPPLPTNVLIWHFQLLRLLTSMWCKETHRAGLDWRCVRIIPLQGLTPVNEQDS